MVNKNKPKMVTIQVVKGWNEGRVLSPGDRIEVHPKRAKAMEQLGYAIRIDPESPYTHPAAKPEHQFKEVKFEAGEELIGEPPKTEITKAVAHEPGASIEAPAKIPEPKQVGALVTIPSLNDLTFTNKAHVKALKRNGIHVIPDLDGWDVDGLTGINGVSRKTAIKLIDAFNQYCNLDHNKDSGMVVKTK